MGCYAASEGHVIGWQADRRREDAHETIPIAPANGMHLTVNGRK